MVNSNVQPLATRSLNTSGRIKSRLRAQEGRGLRHRVRTAIIAMFQFSRSCLVRMETSHSSTSSVKRGPWKRGVGIVEGWVEVRGGFIDCARRAGFAPGGRETEVW